MKKTEFFILEFILWIFCAIWLGFVIGYVTSPSEFNYNKTHQIQKIKLKKKHIKLKLSDDKIIYFNKTDSIPFNIGDSIRITFN